MSLSPSAYNSESQDDNDSLNKCQISNSKNGNINSKQTNSHNNNTSAQTLSAGYYNAEKCRLYIASQVRVSKIDRFAAQVCKAVEIEVEIRSRISNLIDMFSRRSAQAAHDFTSRCKSGLQRHRQDRILSQPRRKSKSPRISVDTSLKRFSRPDKSIISNDLLYGQGARLVHKLLTSQQPVDQHKSSIIKQEPSQIKSVDDNALVDLFEPDLYVKNLDDTLKLNLQLSKSISSRLDALKYKFEELSAGHRDKVDIVYAAEEERQSLTVIRRSAYNLSMAAIKATSTPVFVNSSSSQT